MSATTAPTAPASHDASAHWTPTGGRLLSRFAADVDPANVLPEYPRPQMTRDAWTSLNGLWSYAITPVDSDRPDTHDGQILVPFAVESALSGVARRVEVDQALWYEREVTIEDQHLADGQRVLLHFGAVDWHTKIYVNGTLAGEHKGGYDPFTIDLTDHVSAGTNTLAVQAVDPQDTQPIATGKQTYEPEGIWYTPVTGIWQTVWLESVPATSIRSLKITPDVDAGVVRVSADVEGPGSGSATLRVSVSGHSANETAEGTGEIAVSVPNAKLWSPDTPDLYDLNIDLVVDGETVDSVGSYFGMRKVEVKPDARGHNRLFLNDKAVFHWGMLDQGWWPDGLYTAPTDDALKYDLELHKLWGFNTTRKHVKVEPARWFYHCDRIGLLVWQDMPNLRNPQPEWIRDPSQTGPDAEVEPQAAAQFRSELKAIIESCRNHPCVVMWVPFNERWGQHKTAETAAFVKDLDPTRPVNSASGGNFHQVGDVLDIHSYPDPKFPGLDDTQTSVCGEFGGLGYPVPGHTWQDQKNWGYTNYESQQAVADAYVTTVEMLLPLIDKGLAAAIYTQTTDVEVEVNGLITYDRKVIKVEPESAAATSAKLYQAAEQAAADR